MVDQFRGRYFFLSNFYPATVKFEGLVYPTAEHAYQAAKTDFADDRRKIRELPTPGQAKRAGGRHGFISISPDWDSRKTIVMEEIVYLKFSRHPSLAKWLLDTGEEKLVEGNYWGDTYWGVCNGKGQNHLGRILMKVRARLKEQNE